MSTPDRITEIRERLAKATPGPWEVAGTSIVTEAHCIAVIEGDGGYEAPPDERDANGSLIANAPGDLAFLLAEIERVKQERNDLLIENATVRGHRAELEQSCDYLRAERDAARK